MLAANLADLWAYRDLVRHLVLRDLRHKYKGSTLGFAWSLGNPLLMAAVYTVAFKYIVRLPIDRFPLFLLSGLLPWTFFAAALGAATSSVVDGGPLVRKVAFPRVVLPLAAVLSQFAQFVLAYAVIIPLVAGFEGGLDLPAVAVVPLMALQLVFTFGLGLALATAYVFARDTRHLVDVGLQVWFWVTPIVYSLALVPPALVRPLAANPMTHLIGGYHAAVVDGAWPDGVTWLVAAGTSLGAVLLGLGIFARFERWFAEKL